jgi:hypothetical protein
MNLAQLKSLVGQAKTIQASNTSNPNIRDYVGQKIVVTGMIITKDILVAGLGTKLDKVTFNLLAGKAPASLPGAPEITALDSFHDAAVNHAEDLIPVLGTTFPAPMEFVIVEKPIKDGTKYTYYAEFLGLYDDPNNPLAFQELEEDLNDLDGGLEPVDPNEDL